MQLPFGMIVRFLRGYFKHNNEGSRNAIATEGFGAEVMLLSLHLR